eukprot:m.240746 g.240746  ORF g.240746 m.240746 type:complete len:1667 (+) comp17442_c0_seq1:156-5156(+)
MQTMDDPDHLLRQLEKLRQQGFITELGYRELRKSIQSGQGVNAKTMALLQMQPSSVNLNERQYREQRSGSSHALRGPRSQDRQDEPRSDSRSQGGSPKVMRRPSLPPLHRDHHPTAAPASRLAQVVKEETRTPARKASVDRLVVPEGAGSRGGRRSPRRSDGMSLADKRASLGYTYEEALRDPTQASPFPKVHLPLSPRSPKGASRRTDELNDYRGDGEDSDSSDYELDGKGYELVGDRASRPFASPDAASPYALATARNTSSKTEEPAKSRGDAERRRKPSAGLARSDSYANMSMARRQRGVAPSVRRPQKKPVSHIAKLQSLLTKKSATPNRVPASDFRASASPMNKTSTLARKALANKPPAPALKRTSVKVPADQQALVKERNAVTNLAQLLAWHASRDSKALAYCNLNTNGSVGSSMTWSTLASQARKVAEALLSHDAMVQCAPYCDGTDDAVLIALQPTSKSVLAFFQAVFGCLTAGLVAVPYWVGDEPAPGSAAEVRLRQCLQACNIKAVLTDKDTLKLLSSAKSLLSNTHVLRLDALPSVAKSKHHAMVTDRPSGAALLLPTIDAATNCLPAVVTHSALLSHCLNMEPVLQYNTQSVVVAGVGMTSPAFLWLGLAAALPGCQLQFASVSGDKTSASTIYSALTKAIKGKAPRYAAVDPIVLHTMCQFEVEAAATKANLGDLAGLSLVTNGNSFQKPVADLQHLQSLGARFQTMSVLSVSELAGVVASARVSDILVHPLKASVSLKQRGVLLTAKGSQETISLLAAGTPLPGCRLAVVSVDSMLPARIGELGEVVVSARCSPSVAFAGMTGRSQATFGFPVETTSVAGGAVKMHLFSRTGLIGAVASTGGGEQLFLAGTSASMFHIEKTWCAATDVANTVERVAKSHSSTANNVRKGGIAVLAPTIDKQPRLVVLIEMPSDVEDDVMLLDSWLYRMSSEIEAQHDVRPFCMAFASSGSLPRLTSGVVDFAQCTRLFLTAELLLWHCVLAADACLLNYQPGPALMRDAQMTPLKQMAKMDTKLSELSGATLILGEAVKAARTVISILVKIAAATPKRPLYHVVDYKGREDVITAEGLLKRTRRVAYLLDKKGVSPGDHVLLATPLCSEQAAAFHACLLVGAIPVIAYAPRTKIEAAQWLPILSTIMAGTKARYVLTSDKVAKHMKSCNKDWATSNGVDVISVDSVGTKEYFGVHVPRTRQDLAFLEFSISSAGVLAGVEATHQTMLTVGQAAADQLLNGAGQVLVNLNGQSGLSHAAHTYLPLFTTDCTMVCLDNHPKAKPTTWVKMLSERNMTTALVNHQSLLTCVELANDKQSLELFASLQLKTLKRCFVISQERPWHSVLEAFKTLFMPAQLRPTALLPVLENRSNVFLAATSEALPPLYVDSRALKQDELRVLERGSPHGVPLVAVGVPSPAVKVAVVDPEKEKLCGGDKVGELWFSSVYNAPSYAGLAQDDVDNINEELLHKEMAGKTSFYARSGLLGFVNNGQIYVTGQLEECIVAFGERYNPVDVEDTIERCHSQLLVGGVLVWQMEDGAVIAAVEVDREQDCFKIAPLIAAAVVTRHKVQESMLLCSSWVVVSTHMSCAVCSWRSKPQCFYLETWCPLTRVGRSSAVCCVPCWQTLRLSPITLYLIKGIERLKLLFHRTRIFVVLFFLRALID